MPLEKVSSVPHETGSSEYVSRGCTVLHSVFVPNKIHLVIFLRFCLRIIIFLSSEIFRSKLNRVNRNVVSDLHYSEQIDRSYLINN